ncbi:MAG: hypothetical protein KDF58_04695 [Alphaproteobacteria bacterium]|nr:hypothetical protein [Alphaproteobacteria bacterium]HRW28528.1 hypothetical protein [Emcibacteraceae bacterium]
MGRTVHSEVTKGAVTTDIDMTYDALKAMKKETGKHLPVIAITANALKKETDRRLSKGIDAILHKPVIINDLYKILTHWLPKDDRKRLSKEVG